MYAPVLQHVLDRAPRFARRGEEVPVVAVGKHGAAAAHHLVERPRHAHLEALHRPAERVRVGRLDDEVHVIPLD